MPQFTEIIKFFNNEYPSNQEGLRESFYAFKEKKIKKGDQILHSGKSENQLRFLNNGIVREYYATQEAETNINFYTSPQFITDFASFHAHVPTKKNQEALSDIELLVIDKDFFYNEIKNYECGKSFFDLTFQRILKNKEQFEYNRITKSPEELYKELMIYKPHWLLSIPQYHIASYLNITPETLSRIRKRI